MAVTVQSHYELVMAHLRKQCQAVQGEWNGDEPGEQEDRADAAAELLALLDDVDRLVHELDI